MPIDKLRAMETFVSIIDEGSLTAAALTLNVSLPSVVRQLAALEAHLRVRLVNRTTRSLNLTEEGRAYLERCRAVLADIEDAEVSLQVDEPEPSGSLTITAPVLLGQMRVAPALRRFVQAHAKVRCKLLLLDRLVNLIDEKVDIAIRINELADSSLVSRTVCSVRRVVVASPAQLGQGRVPLHPRELLQRNCLLAGKPWPFRESGVDFWLQLSGNLDFNINAPAIDACLEGHGFGMFLSYQVASHIAEGRLKPVLEEFERPPMPLSIVYPQARLLPGRTRALVDWMRNELSSLGPGLPLPSEASSEGDTLPSDDDTEDDMTRPRKHSTKSGNRPHKI